MSKPNVIIETTTKKVTRERIHEPRFRAGKLSWRVSDVIAAPPAIGVAAFLSVEVFHSPIALGAAVAMSLPTMLPGKNHQKATNEYLLANINKLPGCSYTLPEVENMVKDGGRRIKLGNTVYTHNKFNLTDRETDEKTARTLGTFELSHFLIQENDRQYIERVQVERPLETWKKVYEAILKDNGLPETGTTSGKYPYGFIEQRKNAIKQQLNKNQTSVISPEMKALMAQIAE